MPTSLFIEHHPNGLAFYINGDLQFDTVDEAIYHEYLVMPAIALAVQRFPQTPLQVLICGGGDGLAVRDALRATQVREVTLVDYSPAVLDLGRTVFAPYNQGSLLVDHAAPLGKSCVTVHTQEAFQFVSALPDGCYHVVICDFTFPTSTAETQVYSWEWFQQVRRVLCAGGVMSTNGVSPENRTLGFWCLYQTLLAAELAAKPMQVTIPSFQRHGYGSWGFFLASAEPITRSELESIQFPANLRALEPESWLQAFEIPGAIAQLRHTVNLHKLDCPQLLYYLLNPHIQPKPAVVALPLESEATINFLDIQEAGAGSTETQDWLQIESIAQAWIERLKQAENSNLTTLELEALIPVQHRYHSPQMTQEWLGYIKALLTEIDIKQLLSSLLERAQELPPQLAQELQRLLEKIRTGQPISYLSEHTTELLTILTVTLLMANLSTPDSVFAKGYSRRRSGSSGGYSGDGGGGLGFVMMLLGGFWLWSIYQRRDD